MAFQGAIFDVDGVLVDSPHELAWRESLRELMEGEWRDIRDQTSWTAERFTPAVYQQVMAGKPRMAGARAALEHFGVPDVDPRAERYADGQAGARRQAHRGGPVHGLPRRAAVHPGRQGQLGIRVAAASSSKNAKLFLERIRLDTFAAEQRLDYDFIRDGMTLQELFDADISGRDFPRGKPDPAIFLTAAAELGVAPGRLLRGRGRHQRDPGRQGGRDGGARGGPPGRPGPAAGGGRRPGRDHPGRRLPAGAGRGAARGAAGRRRDPAAAHRAAAERLDAGLRRLRPRPPGAAGGAVRASATATSSPAAPCPRPRPTGSTTRAPTSPASTTGPSHRGRRAHGRERGPGQRAQLAAAAVPDRRRAVVRRRAGRGRWSIAWSWTCATGRCCGGCAGATPRAAGPAWPSAGSSA